MENTLQLRKRIVAWMIHQAVPALNLFRYPKPWPYSLAELREFPKGSMGQEMAKFLDKRKFDLLPKYEIHDAIHTILDYGTITLGELRLQAFMWGNKSSSFAGRVLFLIGMIVLPELWADLKIDYECGKKTRERIADWNITNLARENIDNVRLRIEPPPN